MTHQISIQDLLYGKMSPELSAVTKEPISRQSLKLYAESKNTMFLFLNRKAGGSLPDLSWEMGTALRGGSMTLNTGESPSEENASTLSQILDLNAPEKYYLSPRACAGILRRAEKRGKELPSMLRDALMEVIGLDGGLNTNENGDNI